MGEAVGSMLASAVAVAISPLPLISVILVLTAPHRQARRTGTASPAGRANAVAFTAGWLLGLAAPTALVVVAGTALTRAQTAPTWSSWLKLALGALLLLSAARQWHDRPRAGHVTPPPAWLRAVDRFTAARSAGLALALAAGSPRTLLPVVGGAASIAATSTGPGAEALAAALLVVIGSLCTLLPLAVHLVRGGARSARVLGEWRAWTATHQAAILTTVPVVLGAGYLGDAVSVLT
ncbi:GAP family protein [Kitasatospora sp. Ki12]